jgi:hypothetical protein
MHMSATRERWTCPECGYLHVGTKDVPPAAWCEGVARSHARVYWHGQPDPELAPRQVKPHTPGWRPSPSADPFRDIVPASLASSAPTIAPTRECRAQREARNNYDESAFCQMPLGHNGPHCQSTPWVETWAASLAPSAASGETTAWPVRDVLAKLADAAEHLLRGHDCDHHGYEEVDAAADSARAYLASPASPLGSAPSGAEAETPPSWFALSQELSDELTRTKAALLTERTARQAAERDVEAMDRMVERAAGIGRAEVDRCLAKYGYDSMEFAEARAVWHAMKEAILRTRYQFLPDAALRAHSPETP